MKDAIMLVHACYIRDTFMFLAAIEQKNYEIIIK